MKLLYITLIILFFFKINIISCQSLSDQEYTCLYNLLDKLAYNVTENYPIQQNGQLGFCDDSFIICRDLKVKQLRVGQYSQSTSTISEQDFNCFGSLDYLYLYGGRLSNDFIYRINHLSELSLEACYNIENISYPILNIDTFYLNTSFQFFGGDLKISNLNTYFVMDSFAVETIVNVNLINDLTTTTFYDIIQVISNNIPTLTNIQINGLWLSLREEFYKPESWVNLNTFRDIYEFGIETDFKVDFPLELFNVSGSALYKLSLFTNLNAPSSYINLQSYYNNITTLELVGTVDFHINNDLPFSSLGGLEVLTIGNGNYSGLNSFYIFSTLESLSIITSKLNRPLPTFKRNNLKSLDLSGNGLTGTIDESYCTIGTRGKIPTLDLTNNLLTGFAPGCFLCYIKHFNQSFDLALKQNAPACQINGIVYLDKVKRVLILQGSNLGFMNLIDTSTRLWTPVVNSFRFQTDNILNSVPKNISIRFSESVFGSTAITFQVSNDSAPPCYRECTSKEFCDLKTAKCICNAGWTGEDCEIPNHYATSVTSVDESGGIVIIYGLFGTVHKDISVYIGSLNCDIESKTNTSITCTIGPGTGKKSIYINQNNINWFGKDMFMYTKKTKLCVLNCNNGVCDTLTGECKCKEGWSGLDCNSKDNPDTNTSVDNNGTTIINNDKTNYQVLITKLIEFDGKGEVIKEYSLENNWIPSNSNSNISKFSQQIEQLPVNCTIEYTIEEIKEEAGKNYEFANFNFTLAKGSIKISLSISSYQYYSSLSTLQLQFKSSVGTIEANGCNYNDEVNLDNNGDDEISYITIKKDSSLLYGRFLNRILSDGRPTTISSTKIITNDTDSITIGLNLPMCSECIIDPDFSVLVSSDFKKCNSNNTRPKYVLPVAVVCSIFGAALIVSASYLIYRKKFVENELSKKIKSIEMKSKN